MAANLEEGLIRDFAAIVGEKYAIVDARDAAPYSADSSGNFQGRSPIVLRPKSVTEVSAIMKLATNTGTAIVPQGGNTGLAGGQTPRAGFPDVVLRLDRLNRVREVDPLGNTLVVDCGVVLSDVQKAAADCDRFFPLSLGAEGSCQIGGNLATNAGGTAVLSYGNMRNLCLGLEVVLPTGEVWNGLRRLKKDNTGYCLRELFIGSEGTLGVITGAVLKLFPRPVARQLAFVAVPDPDAALALLELATGICGPSLTTFELLERFCVEIIVKHVQGVRDPLEGKSPWYAMIEVSSLESTDHAEALMQRVLAEGLTANFLIDGVIAASLAQERAIWNLREGIVEAQRAFGSAAKLDVSVMVRAIPAFLEAAHKTVRDLVPGARICAYGHMGDGNIHYNVFAPEGMASEDYAPKRPIITRAVHDIIYSMNGSISAEHGIGQLRLAELRTAKSSVELDLFRRIKAAIDPANIMNPGKLVSVGG